MFKVNNEDTRMMPLAFRIFGSIRHHPISSAFRNMCFRKGRRCQSKKLQKVKQEARILTKLKSDFSQLKFQTKVQCLFFCTSNFVALIILQPETVKLNFTKKYILVDVVEVLALAQPAFLRGEVVNLILRTIYITMNCVNRNCYMSQVWKFGENDCFVTASFPSLLKDDNDNSSPQIHLHNTNTFFRRFNQ